jgi:hypothetical protein
MRGGWHERRKIRRPHVRPQSGTPHCSTYLQTYQTRRPDLVGDSA